MTENTPRKTVVVTGATSGIGLASVEALVKRGAFVIGVGRSETRNQNAMDKILSQNPPGTVDYLNADLANQTAVRNLAKEISQILQENKFGYLDALINNAGGYFEKKQMTDDDIEKTFALNHLAPFILTHELIPYLEKAVHGRVVTVSSYAHYTTPLCLRQIVDPFPYLGLLAYKRSKLCNVLFSYEINRRNNRISAFAFDPGLVDTGIASKGSQGISHWVWRLRRKSGAPPEVPGRILRDLVVNKEIDISHGYYIKEGKSVPPSRNAQRQDLAKDLWTLSCGLTGINW